MKHGYYESKPFTHNNAKRTHTETISLYSGIELAFPFASEIESFYFYHNPLTHILEINYCISGKIGWSTNDGKRICLTPGEFALHTMDICTNKTITLLDDTYQGILLYIALEQFSKNPPVPLIVSKITGQFLLEKYCKEAICTTFSGNKRVQEIFKAFYQSPKELQLAYQKVKVLELLLVLSQIEISHERHLSDFQPEQAERIHQIHDQLINNLEHRISIETLSKQYLMNPTTLKNMFKAIYGTSIAAHIREHRMEYAAQLLQNSNLSIADIASKVGYDSQSRFSSAFKKQYKMLPKEYRKNSDIS